MSNRAFAFGLAAAALIAFGGGAARADKANDTLRLAVDQPIRLIDAIQDPNPEADLMDRAVFDVLVGYDVRPRPITASSRRSGRRSTTRRWSSSCGAASNSPMASI